MEQSGASRIGLLGALCDLGCRRARNEDAIAALPEIGLWIVADGMGGLARGDLASAIAVETIAGEVRRGASLPDAIHGAHHAIASAAAASSPMGATVVAARTDGFSFEVAWVGDARAYSWDGRLAPLTKDHSYIQPLLDAGLLTESAARTHPKRNIVTQMLGAATHPPKPGVAVGTLEGGARLLLCSDGLTRELADDDISAVLASEAAPGDLTARLVEEANRRGGRDNVSVILLECR